MVAFLIYSQTKDLSASFTVGGYILALDVFFTKSLQGVHKRNCRCPGLLRSQRHGNGPDGGSAV